MSCNCGNKTCRGCKDIKVEINTFGLDETNPAVDNGDGTVTINFNDGSDFTFSTGTPPNDNWVEFDETTVATPPTFTGSATLNGVISLDGIYKVINVDTIVIRVQARMNCDITALDNSINFNFDLGTVSSNWYAGTKLPTMTTTGGTIQGWVPVSVVVLTPVDSPRYTVGRASTVEVPAPDGLIQVGNTNLQLPNGTYDFAIDFEMTCKLV